MIPRSSTLLLALLLLGCKKNKDDTETDPPVEEEGEDEAFFAAISDALEHYGDDVWGTSIWKTPWPYLGGLGVACLMTWAFDVWPCGGGGDATGTVIVSP